MVLSYKRTVPFRTYGTIITLRLETKENVERLFLGNETLMRDRIRQSNSVQNRTRKVLLTWNPDLNPGYAITLKSKISTFLLSLFQN
jgi:hypothetical protein